MSCLTVVVAGSGCRACEREAIRPTLGEQQASSLHVHRGPSDSIGSSINISTQLVKPASLSGYRLHMPLLRFAARATLYGQYYLASPPPSTAAAEAAASTMIEYRYLVSCQLQTLQTVPLPGTLYLYMPGMNNAFCDSLLVTFYYLTSSHPPSSIPSS